MVRSRVESRVTGYFVCLYKLGNADVTKDDPQGAKHEGQRVRPRRSVVSASIQSCYTPFFASATPPTGFRTDHTNIRYICQQIPHNAAFFYSTMFDLNYGIPIYSAYVVSKTQATQFGTAMRPNEWRQEAGKLPADLLKYIPE